MTLNSAFLNIGVGNTKSCHPPSDGCFSPSHGSQSLLYEMKLPTHFSTANAKMNTATISNSPATVTQSPLNIHPHFHFHPHRHHHKASHSTKESHSITTDIHPPYFSQHHGCKYLVSAFVAMTSATVAPHDKIETKNLSIRHATALAWRLVYQQARCACQRGRSRLATSLVKMARAVAAITVGTGSRLLLSAGCAITGKVFVVEATASFRRELSRSPSVLSALLRRSAEVVLGGDMELSVVFAMLCALTLLRGDITGCAHCISKDLRRRRYGL